MHGPMQHLLLVNFMLNLQVRGQGNALVQCMAMGLSFLGPYIALSVCMMCQSMINEKNVFYTIA